MQKEIDQLRSHIKNQRQLLEADDSKLTAMCATLTDKVSAFSTRPHVLYVLQTLTCSLFHEFALPLHSVVLMLQSSLSGTYSHLAFATLPLPIFCVAFLKLTSSKVFGPL